MKIFSNRLSLGAVFTSLCLVAMTGCARDPAPTASASTGTKPAAVVNGVAIPSEIIDLVVAEQTAQGAQETPTMRDEIRGELVRLAILEQDAIKAGIHKRPDTIIRLNMARQSALIQAYLLDWTEKNVPTDEEMMQEYEKIKASMGEQKEYRARHILHKTEKEAQATISRLGKGGKFAELASKSLDPGSRDNGGDLGWAGPSMFVPAFSEAMTRLSKGEYSKKPVKTEYGYHVILLEDVRDVQHPSFEEVKPELQKRLQQQKLRAHVEQLESSADIK